MALLIFTKQRHPHDKNHLGDLCSEAGGPYNSPLKNFPQVLLLRIAPEILTTYSSRSSVQPAQLPAPVARPPLYQLFARAFALLPSIHSFYGCLTQQGKVLYDYLFNRSATLVPAGPDADEELPDDPMQGSSPAPMEVEPTPFLTL